MPGKRDLTLLFGVRLLSAMGVTLILPVMPAMARTFGLSIAEAGMVVVCFTLRAYCPIGSGEWRFCFRLCWYSQEGGFCASLRRAGEMC